MTAVMEGDRMYMEHILEHYAHPTNTGVLDPCAIKWRESNPACGDVIEITATVDDGKVSAMRFHGTGCAISQASASILMEAMQGRELASVAAMGKDDMMKLLGVEIVPTRTRCALLALRTVQAGLEDFQKRNAV